MVPRLEILEVVWRGPWILVIFPSKEHKKLFATSKIKLFWGNDCKAEGYANTFFNPEEESDDKVKLDIVEVCDRGNLGPPTYMVISLNDQELTLPISPISALEIKARQGNKNFFEKIMELI